LGRFERFKCGYSFLWVRQTLGGFASVFGLNRRRRAAACGIEVTAPGLDSYIAPLHISHRTSILGEYTHPVSTGLANTIPCFGYGLTHASGCRISYSFNRAKELTALLLLTSGNGADLATSGRECRASANSKECE
jgi:hypothetical protein